VDEGADGFSGTAADPTSELTRRIAQLTAEQVERRVASERAGWVATVAVLTRRSGGEVRVPRSELAHADLTSLDVFVDQATDEIVYRARVRWDRLHHDTEWHRRLP
jgi:hypothetical protein